MMILDDEKGGPYHGPFAWPGGVPIVGIEEAKRKIPNNSTEVQQKSGE